MLLACLLAFLRTHELYRALGLESWAEFTQAVARGFVPDVGPSDPGPAPDAGVDPGPAKTAPGRYQLRRLLHAPTQLDRYLRALY